MPKRFLVCLCRGELDGTSGKGGFLERVGGCNSSALAASGAHEAHSVILLVKMISVALYVWGFGGTARTDAFVASVSARTQCEAAARGRSGRTVTVACGFVVAC